MKTKIVKSKIREDFEIVMSTPSGRRVLWQIMTNSKTFGTSFDDNPYITAYNEGKRSVGSEIYSDLMNYCPERFLQAQNEFNSSVMQETKKIKELTEKEDEEEQ